MKSPGLVLKMLMTLFALQLVTCTRTAPDYEIVAQKHFGASGISSVTMCAVSTTDQKRLQEIGKRLVGNNQLAFVYFYSDRNNVKDIGSARYVSEAAPADGFIAQYTIGGGLQMNANTYVVKPASGAMKIIPLQQKTRKSVFRWYTYYVENYADTKETDNKMIQIAKQLPFSEDGLTEVFFFNDKANAPKLADDDGWNANESQNSWNAKYGKYCVGYFIVGGGSPGEFSKGWK
jgi:hypothetical protein